MTPEREKMIAYLAAVVAQSRPGCKGKSASNVDFKIVNALLDAIGPGATAIALERHRQVTVEGWDARHDAAMNDGGELLQAAVAYLDVNPAMARGRERFVREEAGDRFVIYSDPWPYTWGADYDKRGKHSPARRLAIAGALVAAEYDRMDGAGREEEG